MIDRIALGKQAEDRALQFLIKQGLQCLERNYRSHQGEIDLIMLDRSTLVFVEVRYRSSTDIVAPIETITQPKQQRIIQTAQHYLYQHSRYADALCRFDVIGIDAEIQWIKNAFEVQY